MDIIFQIFLIIFLGSAGLLILIYLYNYIKTIFSYLRIKKIDFEYRDGTKHTGYLILGYLLYQKQIFSKINIDYTKRYSFENFYHKIPNYLLLHQDNVKDFLFTFIKESEVYYRPTQMDLGHYEDNLPNYYKHVTTFQVDLETKKVIFSHRGKWVEPKPILKQISQKDIDEVMALKRDSYNKI